MLIKDEDFLSLDSEAFFFSSALSEAYCNNEGELELELVWTGLFWRLESFILSSLIYGLSSRGTAVLCKTFCSMSI